MTLAQFGGAFGGAGGGGDGQHGCVDGAEAAGDGRGEVGCAAVLGGAEAEGVDGQEAVGRVGAQVGGDDPVGDDDGPQRGDGAKPPAMPAEMTRS